jgi:hypothetical protein
MEVRPIAKRCFSAKLAIIGALALACVGLTEHAAWSAPQRATRATVTAHGATAKGTYVVRAGDGWFQIAKRHNVSMQSVLAANHATTATKLRVGQVVHLPPHSALPKTARVKSAKPAVRPARPAK